MITFDPVAPWWLLMLLFVAITAFLLWKEFGRKLSFPALRLVAVLIMMVTLAAILFRPHTNIFSSTSILLLTPGYQTSQVDSLVSLTNNLRIVHAPETNPYKGSRTLTSYREIDDLQGNITFVAGQGLPLHALDLLDRKSFTFIPGNPPEGIVNLFVTTRPTINRLSEVTGEFRNISGTHSIALIGPGGKEDSVTITRKGTTHFTLSFTPRQTGPLLYTLTVSDNLGNTYEEKVPLSVDKPSPLKILVVSSYPTFETTFLKNFFAAKGHGLVVRSQMSRSNFSYEYINHAALRFSVLSKNILDEFDLLIIDRQSIQSLSNQESLALKQSIRNGLGVLSLYDVSPKEKDQDDFFPFRTTAIKGDTTTITSGSKRLKLPTLPFRVNDDVPLQQVFTNNSGILSGYTLEGTGRIGFQLLQETYRLLLAGDTLTYGKLWSPLLERIARTNKKAASASITTPFPYYTDDPISLRLISSRETPELLADSVRIPLHEDVQLDDVWQAKIWASTPGWHSIQIDGEKLDYFVSKTGEWQSLAIENQMKANQLNFRAEQIAAETSREIRRIHPLLFYGVFLLAAGFLWLAPKL